MGMTMHGSQAYSDSSTTTYNDSTVRKWMITFDNSTYEAKIYLNNSLLWSNTLSPTQSNINLTSTTGQFLIYPNRNMRETVRANTNYGSGKGPFQHMYYQDYRGYTNNSSLGAGVTGAHRDGSTFGSITKFAIYDEIITWNAAFP